MKVLLAGDLAFTRAMLTGAGKEEAGVLEARATGVLTPHRQSPSTEPTTGTKQELLRVQERPPKEPRY